MRFIAVHGGVGFISPSADKLTKRIRNALFSSCYSGLSRNSPIEMVDMAISVLEDDPCFNAGLGSNLTLSKTVECDASVMDAEDHASGSVGAVSGIKNPIKLARRILECSRLDDQALGRIAPLLLVSQGATEFAKGRYPDLIVPPESLIHDQAQTNWGKWVARLESRGKVSENIDQIHQDTVGAIALVIHEGRTHLVAGVSSGGILLKHPGRIGEAAIVGAGCYASSSQETRRKVAVSVSGIGECIMRSNLARQIVDAILKLPNDEDTHQTLEDILMNKFYASNTKWTEDPQAGILMVVVDASDGSNSASLWAAFLAPTMSIAWGSGSDSVEADVLRRLPKPGLEGKPIIDITSVRLL